MANDFKMVTAENGQKIVLEAQDAIKVTSDTATSADVVLSILEDV